MAQWLAQATHNRLVAGSNPAGPTFDASFKVLLTTQSDQYTMLKEYKNLWFEIIKQRSLNFTEFQYSEFAFEFTIQVRNSPLKFRILQKNDDFDRFSIGYTEYKPGFPYHPYVWLAKSPIIMNGEVQSFPIYKAVSDVNDS